MIAARVIAAGIGAVMVCGGAMAQSATVAVSHDDPDGVVLPGQTINVRVDVTWGSSSVRLAGLAGDVLPTPTTGVSSNITSIFEPGGLVSLGQAAQGGVVGVDVATTPTFGGCYPWPPPAVGMLAGAFVAFDWTAPSDFEGPVTFAFTPDPQRPNVRLFPSASSPAFIEAQTTYVPVTLTVVPGPASLAIVGGLAMVVAARGPRRR